MSRTMRTRWALSGTCAASVALTWAAVSPGEDPAITVTGRSVTGTNRLLGSALNDLGPTIGRAGFTNVGRHNPAGEGPLDLTPSTPLSALLASSVDPAFLELIGQSPDDVPQGDLNVPLRDASTTLTADGLTRGSLPGILETTVDGVSQAYPYEPVTLRDWLEAKGRATFRCHGATGEVRLELRDLIPNRLYTVWGILGGDSLSAIPLGGLPNVLVTNLDGSADFVRTLSFCLPQSDSERPLLLVDVVYHADHQVYGALPDLPLAGLYTGVVNNTQLEFVVPNN